MGLGFEHEDGDEANHQCQHDEQAQAGDVGVTHVLQHSEATNLSDAFLDGVPLVVGNLDIAVDALLDPGQDGLVVRGLGTLCSFCTHGHVFFVVEHLCPAIEVFGFALNTRVIAASLDARHADGSRAGAGVKDMVPLADKAAEHSGRHFHRFLCAVQLVFVLIHDPFRVVAFGGRDNIPRGFSRVVNVCPDFGPSDDEVLLGVDRSPDFRAGIVLDPDSIADTAVEVVGKKAFEAFQLQRSAECDQDAMVSQHAPGERDEPFDVERRPIKFGFRIFEDIVRDVRDDGIVGAGRAAFHESERLAIDEPARHAQGGVGVGEFFGRIFAGVLFGERDNSRHAVLLAEVSVYRGAGLMS